jgi:electron transfer flavoprotein beta subunit
MNIVVLVKLVPDLVEELCIADSGTALDTAWIRQVINELDNHALEQAVLLKEAAGGQVTVVAPEADGADDVLFAAAAKGADRLIKLGGPFEESNNHALARVVAQIVGEVAPDLVLTGVQAHNDLDGAVGPLLAEFCGLPYVGYVAGVELGDGQARVRKEYAGGLAGELAVDLPAVLGIQVAQQPPRYVAISKIRQAMSTSTIEERDAGALDPEGGPVVERMSVPQAAQHAEMLEGTEDAIATRLVEVFRDLGLV